MFSWQQEEDVEKLWAMVVQLLQFKDVPNDWIEEKFGIVCTDKAFTVPGQLSVPHPGKSIFFATPPDRVQGAARKTGGGLRTG